MEEVVNLLSALIQICSSRSIGFSILLFRGDYTPEEHFVKHLSLETLTPLTTYHYGITRAVEEVVLGEVGSFSTPASEGTRMDFTIATGSCALTGSKSAMFTNILDVNPFMFIHVGDFHYEDLNTLDIDKRLEAND